MYTIIHLTASINVNYGDKIKFLVIYLLGT